jgi:hypothetical protein
VKAAVLLVARSGFPLWAAFILAHLWLGLLNLYGPGYPMGDVTSVYKFWVDQLIVNDFQVGIDSQWVYPILAFVPMIASLAFGSALYGSTWLSIVMLLNVVALGVLTDWGRRRDRDAAGWWWVAFLFLLGPIALGRIDAVTVPLALIGMLLLTRHPRAAALILTIATWIKIWPAALIAAVAISVQERFRIIAVAAMTSLGIIIVALLMGSGSNVLSFITQQTGRGLQIESPVSSIWLWMARVGVPNTFVYYDQAILTFQVEGPGATLAAMAMTPLLAAAVLVVCALGIVAVRRGVPALLLLPPLALALVTAFIIFNKVGSPQFESWLAVPVIVGLVTARLGGRSFRVPAALVLVIAALTQAIYPYLYNYVLSVNYVMLIVLTSRNLLLVGLCAWAIVAVVRLYRGARGHDVVHDDRAEPTSWPLDDPRDDALQESQPS